MKKRRNQYDRTKSYTFTKTVCAAKNRNDLMKAVKISEDLGLVEGRDFFLIRDSCLTELEPEEFDDAGNGMTLTCIGFSPMDDDLAHKISRKYQSVSYPFSVSTALSLIFFIRNAMEA